MRQSIKTNQSISIDVNQLHRVSSTLGGIGAGGAAGLPSSGSGSINRSMFNPVSTAEPYFRPFNVTPSSASQFVLAEASRHSPSPHLVHQSPVLNTEELYRAAGWMTPLPKPVRKHTDDSEGID